MNTVLLIMIEFFLTGLFAVGGGLATIPFLEEMSVKYGWFSLDMLSTMIAVSESTPGPIMVNMATFVGSAQAGFLGSAVATFGVVFPSFCVILLVTAILKNLTDNKYFKAILQGLKPCVIGIILATGLHLIVTNCVMMKDSLGVDIKAICILLILVAIMLGYQKVTQKKLSPIMLIVVSAVVGIGIGAVGF